MTVNHLLRVKTVVPSYDPRDEGEDKKGVGAERLNFDTIREILARCTLQERAICSQVCKKWNAVISSWGTIDKLPVELMVHNIFAGCSPQELAIRLQVCKRWNGIITANDRILWQCHNASSNWKEVLRSQVAQSNKIAQLEEENNLKTAALNTGFPILVPSLVYSFSSFILIVAAFCYFNISDYDRVAIGFGLVRDGIYSVNAYFSSPLQLASYAFCVNIILYFAFILAFNILYSR